MVSRSEPTQGKLCYIRGIVLKKEVSGRRKKWVDARRLQGHKCTQNGKKWII